VLTLVAEDAARAVRSGTEPHHRLVPQGAHSEYQRWTVVGNRSWQEAMCKRDELEKKAKEQQERKAAQQKDKEKHDAGK